ncbi:MAG TPA: hypothetical protein QGF58_19765 [Myxococcota bacterium]|nr:hypothetical protein [Myxococcota bacterium]
MRAAARQDVHRDHRSAFESDAAIEVIDEEDVKDADTEPFLPRAIPDGRNPRLPLLMGALVIVSVIGAGLAILG